MFGKVSQQQQPQCCAMLDGVRCTADGTQEWRLTMLDERVAIVLHLCETHLLPMRDLFEQEMALGARDALHQAMV